MTYGTAYNCIKQMYEKRIAMANERSTCLEQYPEYSKSHIFDKEKSVRWNREEAERRNLARQAVMKKYLEAEAELNAEGENIVKQFIKQEFDMPNDITVNCVYNMAYDLGHAGGFLEILAEANRFGAFAKDILDIKEKAK